MLKIEVFFVSSAFVLQAWPRFDLCVTAAQQIVEILPHRREHQRTSLRLGRVLTQTICTPSVCHDLICPFKPPSVYWGHTVRAQRKPGLRLSDTSLLPVKPVVETFRLSPDLGLFNSPFSNWAWQESDERMSNFHSSERKRTRWCQAGG